jgi:hypothetical protein
LWILVDGRKHTIRTQSEVVIGSTARLGSPSAETLVEFGEDGLRITPDARGHGRAFAVSLGELLLLTDDPWQAAQFLVAHGAKLRPRYPINSFADSPLQDVIPLTFGFEHRFRFDESGWTHSRSSIAIELTSRTPRIQGESLQWAFDRTCEDLLGGRAATILVSGGIDSCVVLDSLARVSEREKLRVLHLRWPDQERSWEDTLARTLARRYGVDFVELQLAWSTFADEAALACGAVFYPWAGWRNVIQRELARREAVAFWGVGAEVFQTRHHPTNTRVGLGELQATPAHWWRGHAVAVSGLVMRPRRAGHDVLRFFRAGANYGFANSLAGDAVETRSPFLEPGIASRAGEGTDATLIDKTLLRASFAGTIPESALWHPRIGTLAPTPERFRIGSESNPSAAYAAAISMELVERRLRQEPNPLSAGGVPPLAVSASASR